MEAGAAQVKEHHVDGTSSVQVLKGQIRYRAQGQVYELGAGSLLTLGASIKHEVEAMEEAGFLLDHFLARESGTARHAASWLWYLMLTGRFRNP